MVTSSGDKLLEEDAVQAYKDYLFPRTSILTPNKKEAEWLCGKELNEGNIEECCIQVPELIQKYMRIGCGIVVSMPLIIMLAMTLTHVRK